MKVLEKQRDVQVNGDFKLKRFGLEVTPQLFHHMSSTLYNDKMSAVLREYHNNGWDSHILAGHKRPVKVQLPTRLDPRLVFRDFGVGLSEEDCFNVFSVLFKSTKQDSNDFNGSLGLGAKSGFSLSESFNVTSFLNGRKIMLNAFKDEKGYPNLAKLLEEKTDEPNGLEISLTIPINLIYSVINKAVNVYKILEVTPDINLKEVSNSIKEFKDRSQIWDNIILDPNDRGLKVIMSNVCYKYNYVPESITNLVNSFGVYIEIPNGSGEFNLGREDLVHTEHIDKILEESVAKAIPEMIKEVQEEVDDCEYENDARKIIYTNVMGSLFSDKILYKNSKLNKVFVIKKDNFVDYYRYSYGSKCTKHNKNDPYDPNISINPETSVFSEPETGYLTRIKNYVRQNNKSVVILTKKQAVDAGINPKDIQDPKDLPEPYKPNSSSYSYSAPTIQCYKISDGKWCNFEGRLPDNSVYVTIFRKDVDCSALYTGGVSSVTSVIKSMSGVIKDMEDVYVIRRSIKDRVWFKKLTTTKLDDYLKDKLKDYKTIDFQRTYSYKNYDKLIEFFPKDKDVITLNHDSDNGYINFYSDDKNVRRVDVNDLDKSLEKKYPILKILDIDEAFKNDGNKKLLKKALGLC